MVFEIIQYGDERLQKPCETVTEFTDEVKAFIDELVETVEKTSNCAGLAAPQVGVLWRIFVVRHLTIDKEGYHHYGDPRVIINPELSELSDEIESYEEGCMSIPLRVKDVPRYYALTLTALDRNGKKFTEKLSGHYARMMQHETDHLDGILMMDRVLRDERKKYYAKLNKLLKKKRPKL